MVILLVAEFSRGWGILHRKMCHQTPGGGKSKPYKTNTSRAGGAMGCLVPLNQEVTLAGGHALLQVWLLLHGLRIRICTRRVELHHSRRAGQQKSAFNRGMQRHPTHQVCQGSMHCS